MLDFHRTRCTLAAVAALLPLAAAAQEPQMAEPTQEMQAVLDKLAELGAEPLSTLSVEAARSQPTPADAVAALIEERGIETDPALDAIATTDVMIPGAAGEVPARVFTPDGEGPFPVIVYWHGGGWVIAGIDTYAASARQLAAGTDAVVVSVSYRQAPEHPFPAAHEDAVAAYEWIVENAGQWNGDVDRLAVAGESAGGNLAANVAIAARDNGWIEPDHQLLVYPVAGDDMTTESYIENAEAQPLSKAGMEWFVDKVFTDPAMASDPRLDLVSREDLGGLPPATIINAEIDPLRTEGETYAEHLSEAGVEVTQETYEGVVHEFFGMAAVVPAAEEAMSLAVSELNDAFADAD
ncbi:putative lipase [Oceanicola granulosus HTCC2516]|uniref:Putative lipase n=1 Tax=Oceanicola granulosus (strain ATCC BAA-861 / DSM 15982 / KCTC 12143 / HTCC2516) TaxID=314256 RepID=Q2CIC7_OCEGH|nr:alpha/beta hydrolase [Oceanicola granulosus]EAR52331.1 putative lipase [Oceanicola granulosus HTCC2516]